MKLEIEYTCPLGSKCEEVRNNKLYRCRWFVNLKGNNPQTGEALDEFRCTEEWNVLLAVENTQKQIEIGAAIESFRNKIVPQQETFLGLVKQKQNELANSIKIKEIVE